MAQVESMQTLKPVSTPLEGSGDSTRPTSPWSTATAVPDSLSNHENEIQLVDATEFEGPSDDTATSEKAPRTVTVNGNGGLPPNSREQSMPRGRLSDMRGAPVQIAHEDFVAIYNYMARMRTVVKDFKRTVETIRSEVGEEAEQGRYLSETCDDFFEALPPNMSSIWRVFANVAKPWASVAAHLVRPGEGAGESMSQPPANISMQSLQPTSHDTTHTSLSTPSRSTNSRSNPAASQNEFMPIAAHSAASIHLQSFDRLPFSVCASTQSLLNYGPVLETDEVHKQIDDLGFKQVNDYLFVRDIGRGSFGKVKLAVHVPTGENRAIKVLRSSKMSATHLDQLRLEIAIMKKLRHKNLIRMHEVIHDNYKGKVYLVMQYVERGRVLEISQCGTADPLPEKQARKYVRQLISGLQYLHKHDIIHRDIKPDNILISEDDKAYLSDFGVSEIVSQSEQRVQSKMNGTVAFMSPEVCRGEDLVHGKAVDVWALGVTLYVFLLGRLPFVGESLPDLIDSIQNASLYLPRNCPRAWRNVLSEMLNKDPNRRITLQKLKQHPFFLPQEASPDEDELNSTLLPPKIAAPTMDPLISMQPSWSASGVKLSMSTDLSTPLNLDQTDFVFAVTNGKISGLDDEHGRRDSLTSDLSRTIDS